MNPDSGVTGDSGSRCSDKSHTSSWLAAGNAGNEEGKDKGQYLFYVPKIDDEITEANSNE